MIVVVGGDHMLQERARKGVGHVKEEEKAKRGDGMYLTAYRERAGFSSIKRNLFILRGLKYRKRVWPLVDVVKTADDGVVLGGVDRDDDFGVGGGAGVK